MGDEATSDAVRRGVVEKYHNHGAMSQSVKKGHRKPLHPDPVSIPHNDSDSAQTTFTDMGEKKKKNFFLTNSKAVFIISVTNGAGTA